MSGQGGDGRTVRAAGVLPTRLHEGVLQVALVHRAKYDDWSWPKGKLDHGEDFATAAVRETFEETGLQVRLGRPLPTVRYRLRSGEDKVVRYWAGDVIGGHGRLEHEIDDLAWLSPTLAARRLTYRHDQELLGTALELHADGGLATWPLLVVRHAHAIPRGDWDGPDEKRPLSAAGRRRAEGRIAALLAAYAPTTVLSSPAVRCVDTVLPFAERSGTPLETKKGLSEEGFEKDPAKVDKHLHRLVDAGRPAALCTHGPLLPRIVSRLIELASAELEPGERRMLVRLRDVPMDKGEILACTLHGVGPDARLVAVERHRPSS